MTNLRGIRASVLAGFAGFSAIACEHELTISPPVNPADAVIAQFDPTNPIPVLQLVPSPTQLADPDGDGRLNVTVQECERPSTKQCLALTDGWPTTTPITLFFSGEIDESSLADGVKIVKAGTATPLAFSATQGPRPAPNAACATGGNGSTRTYNPDTDVPPGVAVAIRTNEPLEGGTQYLLYVISYVDETGAVKGLKTKDGKRVEPSSLFALLNAPDETPPVTPEGIPSPLLRSNVVGLLLAQEKFGGKRSLAELTAEERAIFDADLAGRLVSLNGLYAFFKGTIGAGLQAQVVSDRKNLVFANTWRTGSAAPTSGGEVLFDPLRQKVPFPNAQLLTTATSTRVTIPINPCGETPTPGCDSPSAQALKGGLNTLDGFSTTAPITVPFSANLDPATLADNVRMWRVDPTTNQIMGSAVEIVLEAKTSSGTDDAALLIRPASPLAENAHYVIALKKGIKAADGGDIRRPQTFNFLTVREPLLGMDGAINPDAEVAFPGAAGPVPVQTVLQCSTVSATGQLATDAVVNGTAASIELQLRRARWAAALDALRTAASPIPEAEILMAWTHKTQTITGTTDLIIRQLMPNVYPNVLNASMIPPITPPVRSATTAAQVQGTILVALCQSGQLAAVLGNIECLVNGAPNPQLFTNPLVQQLLPLFTTGIGAMRLHLMANTVITRGNPLGAGGTFTPNTVMQPRVIQTPIWVITPQGVPDAPVVIFQHGLGQVKESGFFIAGSFARAGYATVLMDLPFHGTRASDLVNNMTGAPCPATQPEMVTCDPTTRMCTGGCDGLQDSSGTGFLSSNVFAARDNFRQGTVDQMTLVRLIQSQSMAGGALADLDGARVGYAGQSLGGITGGNLVAYAPELTAAVLNVPGGGLINILLSTVPQISAPLFAALAASGVCVRNATGCEDTATFRQFQITAQTALDPGDPLANSIGLLAPHNMVPPLTPAKVLIQMATPDLVVTNPTTRALGASYGFDVMDNSASSRFQTYTMTGGANCHGFLLFPGTCVAPELGTTPLVGGFCATFGAQQQAARFIATAGAMVGPRGPDTSMTPAGAIGRGLGCN